MQWSVAAVLLLVPFALGVIAYRDVHWGWTDSVYGSLRLFRLDYQPPAGNHVSAVMDVARFLAPVAAAVVAALAAFALFARTWRVRRDARRSRGHIVVAGSSPHAAEALLRFQKGDHSVVHVPEPGSAAKPGRVGRTLTLPPSAFDATAFRDAGAQRARAVIVLATSDELGLAAAAVARELAAGAAGTGPRLLVAISDDALCETLRHHQVVSDDTVELDFFSLEENAALRLLDHLHGPADRPHTLLVVGDSRLAENIVLQEVRFGLSARASIAVDVVVPEGSAFSARVLPRLPRRGDDRLRIVERPRADLERGEVSEVDLDAPTAVVVALRDERDSLVAGTAIAAQRAGGVVVSVESSSVAAFVSGSHDSLDVRTTASDGLDPSVLLEDSRGLLARAVHRNYVHERRQAGDTPATNPSLVSWTDLPDSAKADNRHQASQIVKSLREHGFAVRRLTGRGAEFTLPEDVVKALAEREHERWLKERKDAGWTYGERSDAERSHPDLVEWVGLPDASRKKDMDAVEAWPRVLGLIGLEITRATTAD